MSGDHGKMCLFQARKKARGGKKKRERKKIPNYKSKLIAEGNLQTGVG